MLMSVIYNKSDYGDRVNSPKVVA